jgi:hypothetical protein
MAIFESIALIFAATSTPAGYAVKDNQNVIRISNVCIDIRHGYQYSIVGSIDYFRLNISYKGVTGYIYVGYNPEILGDNRKWQSHSLRATMTSSRIVALEGGQTGQVLGVPLNEKDEYFHVWFKDGDSTATGPIKAIVRFCK